MKRKRIGTMMKMTGMMTTRTMRRMIGCKRMMKRRLSIAIKMKRMVPQAVGHQVNPRKPNLIHKRRSKARVMATVVSGTLRMTKTRRISSQITMMTKRKNLMRPSISM